MKYRGIKLLGIGLIGILSVVGCSTQNNEDVVQLQQQLTVIQKENKVLEATTKALEEKLDKLTKENKSLILEIEELTKEQYLLYSRDVDSWEIIEEGKISINKDLSLQEKVQELANQLSEELFEGLTIEVKEIKKINGDDIAVINLQETEGSKITWMQDYFQGSTGASITQTKLEETLLQKNNPIEWVDGIQILYNGEELMANHLIFESIIYR